VPLPQAARHLGDEMATLRPETPKVMGENAAKLHRLDG
jgi:hypothetical protein